MHNHFSSSSATIIMDAEEYSNKGLEGKYEQGSTEQEVEPALEPEEPFLHLCSGLLAQQQGSLFSAPQAICHAPFFVGLRTFVSQSLF